MINTRPLYTVRLLGLTNSSTCKNTIQNVVFWVLALCCLLVVYRSFGRTCCLSLQSWRRRQYILQHWSWRIVFFRNADTQPKCNMVHQPIRPPRNLKPYRSSCESNGSVSLTENFFGALSFLLMGNILHCIHGDSYVGAVSVRSVISN